MPTDVCVEMDKPERASSLVAVIESTGDELLAGCQVADRELSVLLTDDTGIQALNVQWRGLDEPTDVLSFAFDEVVDRAEGMPLGDIVLNIDRAELQRHDHGLSLEHELIYLLVHGVCHLRGFDHAEPEESVRMKREEERLLELVHATLRRPDDFF